MEIENAITVAEKNIALNKRLLAKKARCLAKAKKKREENEIERRKKKKALVKEIYAKGRMMDENILKGIKFIETHGLHFKVSEGMKYAIYFCSNRTFQAQIWGWYMGNDNIKDLRKRYETFDAGILRAILKVNFRKLLVKQILALPKHRKASEGEYLREMFG